MIAELLAELMPDDVGRRRLEESYAAVDKAMPALPTPTEADWPTRRSRQFWRR